MIEINRNLNVVVIGGGTGSSIVLKGLKKYDGCNLSAIVPMGDSGGSSGKLRDEFGILSAGEIRQRLIALADGENASDFVKLLDHRFEKGKDLKGHNLGNILITGLTELHGSQEKAIEILSKMVKAKGKITPSTWDKFELVADYADGKKIIGEHFIDEPDEDNKIIRLYTEPDAKANPQATEEIKSADMIIFSPGDLYTSILHNIIVDGIHQAIRESKAKKVYICNLMTSIGETTDMTLQDMIDELEKYIGAKAIDFVIVNSRELPDEIVKEYENNGQFPVKNVLNEEIQKRIKILNADVLAEELYVKSKSDMLHRSMLRHDSDKLGAVLINLLKEQLNNQL